VPNPAIQPDVFATADCQDDRARAHVEQEFQQIERLLDECRFLLERAFDIDGRPVQKSGLNPEICPEKWTQASSRRPAPITSSSSYLIFSNQLEQFLQGALAALVRSLRSAYHKSAHREF
jgi:hypothetical protein